MRAGWGVVVLVLWAGVGSAAEHSCPIELMKVTRQAYNLDNVRDDLEKAKASLEIELYLERERSKKLQLDYDRIQAELNKARQSEVEKLQR